VRDENQYCCWHWSYCCYCGWLLDCLNHCCY